MKRIVLSGVNFVEAGPLGVFKDALAELSRSFADRYEIIALVHKTELFSTDGIRYLEFPEVKSSWLRRLKFEYWDCRALSRELHAHLWLSMHDVSPNVEAEIKAVYYHNPAPFYRLTARDIRVDWRFSLFSLFYHLLYAINIRRNNFFIVQQQWLREAVLKKYPALPVVVAHPSLEPAKPQIFVRSGDGTTRFLYPALPRSFKNVETILQACALLQDQGADNFQVSLTLNGKENPYARDLFERYGNLAMVRWLGLMPRAAVQECYGETDCLLFPSRLETWGLPISEFKQTGRPMLLADLPYAHEALGTYNAAAFFPADDPQELARQMLAVMRGTMHYPQSTADAVPAPFTETWQELFRLLLGERA